MRKSFPDRCAQVFRGSHRPPNSRLAAQFLQDRPQLIYHYVVYSTAKWHQVLHRRHAAVTRARDLAGRILERHVAGAKERIAVRISDKVSAGSKSGCFSATNLSGIFIERPVRRRSIRQLRSFAMLPGRWRSSCSNKRRSPGMQRHSHRRPRSRKMRPARSSNDASCWSALWRARLARDSSGRRRLPSITRLG